MISSNRQTGCTSAATKISLPSPAKINLFLHVTGRRDDGYHCLQTLFQFLDYGDQLDIAVNSSGLIRREDRHSFNLPDMDLCLKAANLLRRYVQQPDLGCHITLTKRIPAGSGLGGGSSNAATTLLGLNKLWDLKLATEVLIELASQLGADVPVFVHGHAAWAEGVGDRLSVYSPRQGWYLVVIPSVSVATELVFADPRLRRDHPSIDRQAYSYNETTNDLQAVTIALFPEVANALNELNRYAESTISSNQSALHGARMSGSGCAVLLPCADENSARAAQGAVLEQLNSKPGHSQHDHRYSGFVARGVNRSPTLASLENC